MKKKLFFCICILYCSFNYGQSIVSTNKMWNNIIHYYYDYYAWGTEHIKFTTDTIIDSFTYKKVERSLDENQQNWLSYGYIRENEAKQIFYKIAPADTERLLYDLNALVNAMQGFIFVSVFMNDSLRLSQNSRASRMGALFLCDSTPSAIPL